MRQLVIFVGILVAASAAPTPNGPLKISDNNIENIFNINININGVFSNSINQDIISVIVGLLNNQNIDGSSLKDQLKALALKSDKKNLDVDVPFGSIGKGFNFDGLASKIKEAVENKAKEKKEDSSDTPAVDVEMHAKELLKQYLASKEN